MYVTTRLRERSALGEMPRSTDCKLKHLELIAVHESRALAVVVLDGAKVKQKLVTFSETVTQPALTVVSARLNGAFEGLTGRQITEKQLELTPLEKQAADHLMEIMKAEESKDYQEPYLEGWHFMLTQPEFAHSDQMRNLMELVERRGLGSPHVHLERRRPERRAAAHPLRRLHRDDRALDRGELLAELVHDGRRRPHADALYPHHTHGLLPVLGVEPATGRALRPGSARPAGFRIKKTGTLS